MLHAIYPLLFPSKRCNVLCPRNPGQCEAGKEKELILYYLRLTNLILYIDNRAVINSTAELFAISTVDLLSSGGG